MNKLYNYFLALLVLIGLHGCIGDYPMRLYNNIDIYEPTTLTEDKYGVTYHVYNTHLNLNNFTLYGETTKGIGHVAVVLHGTATVSNGTISGYYNGISVDNELDSSVYNKKIYKVTKEQATRIAKMYIQLSSYEPIVDRLTITNSLEAGIYVKAYVNRFILTRSTIIGSGYMGVYLDHNSYGAIIMQNTFEANGYAPREPKEGIAMDSTSNNLISDNTFIANASRGISLYTNYGENSLTRTTCDDNLITHNTFKNGVNGVSIAARQNRMVIGYKGADYAKNNTVSDNTFINVKLPIEVLDTPNYINNNIIK
jgi:parallel beta-helix repeat protein